MGDFRKHIESTLQNELNLNYIYLDPKTTDLIYVGLKRILLQTPYRPCIDTGSGETKKN